MIRNYEGKAYCPGKSPRIAAQLVPSSGLGRLNPKTYLLGDTGQS